MTLGILSCSSNDNIEIDNSDLIGKWNWTNTDGGIEFNIHETPETTGKVISLILNRNYTFSIIENGNEVSDGTYILTMKKSIYSGELERYIQFQENHNYNGVVTTGIINVYENSKLDILDNNFDGIGSGFQKVE